MLKLSNPGDTQESKHSSLLTLCHCPPSKPAKPARLPPRGIVYGSSLVVEGE